MRARSGRSLQFLAALAALTAGCGAETNTFVKLVFDGSVNQDKAIASIAVDLQLGSRTSSTSFPMPSNNPTLPTTGVLQIGSGAGTLYVSARALASDGSVLGTGTGSGTVRSGKTVEVTVLLTGFVAGDAGTDGPEIDTRPPGIDAGIDGGADGVADRASEVATPPDLPPFIDGPGQDQPPPVDAPADAADTAADVPLDVFGRGGAGGSGGTTTGGAGGTGTGGVGGGTGTGGTSATYLLVVNPPAIDFGIVTPGSASPPQTFTITNKGGAPAPVLATFVSDPAHFPIAQDTCKGMTLAPTATCTVSFTFNPTAPGSIRADGGVGPTEGTAPGAKFSLSGTGAGGAAALALAPSPVSFGTVDVNQSVPVQMTLTNGGDSSAGTITVQVTNSPTFRVTNDACSGLPLGGRSQCTFTLVFAPSTFGSTSATVNAQASSGLSASASAVGTGRDYVLLTIQFAGAGAGVVNGVNPPCTSPTPCSINVARTDPTAIPKFDLTAVPNSLSVFGGWGGDCAAAGLGACSVIMDKAHSVIATFNPRMVPISLTVLGVSGGGGTLAAADGSLSCDTVCPNLSHPATTSFTLTAKPASGSSFVAWTSGPCKGTKPECTFSLTDATSVAATFGPPAYMFVTSSTIVPGSLGGIVGGDKECQRLADKVGLPGTYMAWLSTLGDDARKRVGDGGWVRTDGRPFTLLLKTLADPTVPGYPTVYYPPRVDEGGNDLGAKPLLVATGGNTDGTAFGVQCGDYTKPTGDLYVGDASSGSYAWSYTELVSNGCGQPFHLYCFRRDIAAEIVPPKQEGRRVFVTSRPYVMTSTGTANPTVFCQKEADAAGLPDPAKFVAFLATSSTPALKLLNTAGPPWKRLDEVVVSNQVSDFASGKLLAPFSLGPDGMTYIANRVWTGAPDPAAPGTATCNDWRSPTLSTPALVGDGRTTAAPNWFSLGERGAVSCADLTTHLMCVEP